MAIERERNRSNSPKGRQGMESLEAARAGTPVLAQAALALPPWVTLLCREIPDFLYFHAPPQTSPPSQDVQASASHADTISPRRFTRVQQHWGGGGGCKSH